MAAVAAWALGFGASHAAAAIHGGSGVVGLNGQIGTLRIGTATTDDVLAFAGHPDRDDIQSVEDFQNSTTVPYRIMGYTCGRLTCKTTFWVNQQTGLLESFFSSSTKYKTTRGTQVGMTRSAAVYREKHHVHPEGCFPAQIIRTNADYELDIFFRSGPRGRVDGLSLATRDTLTGGC